MRTTLLFLSVLFVTSLSLGARDIRAEDKTENPATQTQTQHSETKAPTPSPYLQELNKKLYDLSTKLEGNAQSHLFLLYNNHNIISTVKTVREDVSNAIDACSKQNPDMENDLKSRFNRWKKAVNEQMQAAEAYRDNMILAQDYIDKASIQDIMDTADKLRVDTAKRIKKVPVNTKEACEYLLNKMDETQDTMLSLLRVTLRTAPSVIQDTQTNAPADADDAQYERQ